MWKIMFELDQINDKYFNILGNAHEMFTQNFLICLFKFINSFSYMFSTVFFMQIIINGREFSHNKETIITILFVIGISWFIFTAITKFYLILKSKKI